MPIEEHKTESKEKQKNPKQKTIFAAFAIHKKESVQCWYSYEDQNQTRCTRRVIHAWIKNKQNGNISVHPKHSIVCRHDLHEKSERQSAAANANTNRNKIISTFFAMRAFYFSHSLFVVAKIEFELFTLPKIQTNETGYWTVWNCGLLSLNTISVCQNNFKNSARPKGEKRKTEKLIKCLSNKWMCRQRTKLHFWHRDFFCLLWINGYD